MLIARFDGDVDSLKRAYDEAHRLIMERGGPPGELRHHCAHNDQALYIISVWESEDHLQRRFFSDEFRATLAATGFPSFESADTTLLQLHATEPPL
jgi:heme-degrading monooxygenase HmoA